MESIASRWRQINDSVAAITQRPPPGAAAPIRIIAVSKRQNCAAIRQAYNAGAREFGESYVQEALQKINRLGPLGLCWHFIGPLQSNKTREIAAHFDWVQSVSRQKIARRLNQQRPDHLKPLQVLLQVNISNEAHKSGVNITQLASLADYCADLPRLEVRGLMAIPAPTDGLLTQDVTTRFDQLRILFEQHRAHYPNWDTLSMGMSSTYPLAISSGATMIRVGTGLFGPRPAKETL